MGLKRQKPKKERDLKTNIYIYGICLLSFIFSVILGGTLFISTQNVTLTVIEIILIFIPVTEIIIKIVESILSKTVKPKLIPKLDFSKEIPKQNTTMVVIPTIIETKDKVKELAKKLEVFYLANKSDNIFFSILGDCTACKKEVLEEDEEIKKSGIAEIERLNQKYPKNRNSKI